MTSSPEGDTSSSFSIVSKVISNEPPSPMSVDGDTSPRLTSIKRCFKPSLGQQLVDDSAMVLASTPNKRALMTITQSTNNVFNTSSGSVQSFTCTPLSSGTTAAVNHRPMRQMSMDCSFTSPIQSKSQDRLPPRWGCSSSQPESSSVQISPASSQSSVPFTPHQRSYSESDIAIMAAVSQVGSRT